MNYNFDQQIDRSNTDALKVDAVKELWGREDLLPLWVADMDFATPDFIIEALKERCNHPILGYTGRPKAWSLAIQQWQKERYEWSVDTEWLNFVPGIVPGIAFAIHCFTKPGDTILIQTPVYHPYILLPKHNNRLVKESPLHLDGGQYQIDFNQFEKDAVGCKLFLLCHPHNPGGRVWTPEELQRMAAICHRNQVLVVSDEIHADLTLPPFRHCPFASVSKEAADNSITFMSPSKAFNMAGLTSSYSIISNPAVREQFHAYLDNSELNLGHLFAYRSVVAAYSHGTEWLNQVLCYISGNIQYVESFLEAHTPKIKMIRPQASYLIFLDCRELQLPQEKLVDFFVDKAHLALNDGSMFGEPGIGFMRLNVASPRGIIEQAMNQLEAAYRTCF